MTCVLWEWPEPLRWIDEKALQVSLATRHGRPHQRIPARRQTVVDAGYLPAICSIVAGSILGTCSLSWADEMFCPVAVPPQVSPTDCGMPTAATAGDAVPCRDEVWLISTRDLGSRPCEHQLRCGQLRYEILHHQIGWLPADPGHYWAEQDDFYVTIVYVHGNRMQEGEARQQGLELYSRLKRCRPTCGPIRLVIWSWPSEPIPASCRIWRDVRVKYRRTASQSYLLAEWLAQASPAARISLIGYSFGARTILGALHLLGGGCLEGRTLPPGACAPNCLRIVLWAAATENTWLAVGGQHCCALRVVNQALITVNRHDPALKRFCRAICRARHRALGYTGLRGLWVGNCCGTRVCELDVTYTVGRRHDWRYYAQAAALIHHTARIVLY